MTAPEWSLSEWRMRNILIFAAVLIGLGVGMARMADTMTPAKSTVAVARTNDVAAASSGRTVSIDKDRNGHFQTEARVDGSYLNFMVDTGATVIALKERDAARVGIHPAPVDYTANVSTANGPAKAARAHLTSIEIGGVRVRDVDALIMPDGMLDQNLLGMAFLSRLKRFEYADGRLVMEQQ
jgi:aspartyl protease family protein